MIKTTELRIGNLVLFAQESTVFKVMDIDLNGIGVDDGDERTWIEIDQFEGVPITEELLLKFGFEKNFISPNVERYSVDGFAINSYSNKEDGDYFWLGYYMNSINKHIEYVHQIQNLYFALTGKELTSK
jgi:hypothetical protein